MAAYPTTVKPKRFNQVVYEYSTKIFDSENGSEQRRLVIPIQRRTYSFEYECLYDDFLIMQTFIDDRMGMYESFTFNPRSFDTKLENESITVRFTSDKLEVTRVLGQIYNFKVQLMELFE